MSEETKKNLNVEKILRVALKKEQDSYSFYDRLLQDTTVAILQDILEELRDEELRHINMIKKKITEISLGRSGAWTLKKSF